MKKNYKYVKLSSKWTTFGFYGVIIMYFLFMPIFIFLALDNFNTNSLIAGVVFLGITCLIYFVLKYMAVSYIKDNIIYMKKFFRPQKQYALNEIENIKTYENKRDKYVVVTMNKDGTQEKFLIINNKLFYSGENIDAETMLQQINQENKLTT